MSGWVFRIGIIAVIAIGALIFRDRLSGNAADLQVGDCFDRPTGNGDVSDVQHHPCTEGHTAEVIFVGTMTGDNAVFPSDPAINGYIDANCLPAWAAYTGKDYQSETVLRVGVFIPTPEAWQDGDRGVTCYATRADGAVMTTSVKKAP